MLNTAIHSGHFECNVIAAYAVFDQLCDDQSRENQVLIKAFVDVNDRFINSVSSVHPAQLAISNSREAMRNQLYSFLCIIDSQNFAQQIPDSQPLFDAHINSITSLVSEATRRQASR